jgi:hypothetical protein
MVELAQQLVTEGIDQAGQGIQMLRAPWLLVEAGEAIKVNRDGEPSEPRTRWAHSGT